MFGVLAGIVLAVMLFVPRLGRFRYFIGLPLLVLLAWAMLRSHQPLPAGDVVGSDRRPVGPTPQLTLPEDVLDPQGLQLTGTGAPWKFSGRLHNRSSDYEIKSVTFRISRSDCYADAPSDDSCMPLWQRDTTVFLVIPPTQARDFSADIWHREAAPRVRGELRDRFDVLTISGATATNEGQQIQESGND